MESVAESSVVICRVSPSRSVRVSNTSRAGRVDHAFLGGAAGRGDDGRRFRLNQVVKAMAKLLLHKRTGCQETSRRRRIQAVLSNASPETDSPRISGVLAFGAPF